jgi:AraC-like DNA-binding protein
MVMNRQIAFPKASDMGPHNTVVIRTLGLDHPEGRCVRRGRDWLRHQVLREDKFLLNVLEGCQSTESIGYTRQEDYIKVNFWLGGKHTTILDGFGQHEHDRPEAFITAGPWEMVKVDLCGRNVQLASVAVCLLPEFFPLHMGVEPDELPEPLRGLLTVSGSRPYAFHRFPLSPDLVGATRSILAAPFAVRREPLYVQAKAIELMYLLMHCMESHARCHAPARGRREPRLLEARELITRRYAEPLTLTWIARDVGLNRMALTSGFRDLFGMSVHDCLQRIRMERAYELLQDELHPIGQIAEAVGYRHSCNFSTAFRAYFGCTPQAARSRRLK